MSPPRIFRGLRIVRCYCPRRYRLGLALYGTAVAYSMPRLFLSRSWPLFFLPVVQMIFSRRLVGAAIHLAAAAHPWRTEVTSSPFFSFSRQSAEIGRAAGPPVVSSMASSAESFGAAPPPPPPPPPPPMPNGSTMPSIRVNSELGNSSAGRPAGGKHVPGGGAPFSYGVPPAAIQNAMMKDKKPFTYTPGGIDLFSEIRSPRMQRRISKNAADEGVTLQQQQPPPPSSGNQLSPQALMAMQPQMAVPVFPPTPQQMPVLHSPVSPPPPPHFEPPSPAAAASIRANLKPAVPNFSNSHYETASRPPPEPQQLPRNPSNPPVQQTPVPAAPAPFVERRNAQLGTIYIPPVSSTVSSGAVGPLSSSSVTSPSAQQVAKTPMPWMNSQNRTPSSPTPPFVQQLQQERVNPIVVSCLTSHFDGQIIFFPSFHPDDAHRSGPVRRRETCARSAVGKRPAHPHRRGGQRSSAAAAEDIGISRGRFPTVAHRSVEQSDPHPPRNDVDVIAVPDGGSLEDSGGGQCQSDRLDDGRVSHSIASGAFATASTAAASLTHFVITSALNFLFPSPG